MPYEIRKADSGFNVVNTETGDVKGHHDSRGSAQRQINLLRGVEHGWKPTGKKARKVKKAAKGVVVDPVTSGMGPRRATGPAPKGPPQVIRTTRETITGRRGSR